MLKGQNKLFLCVMVAMAMAACGTSKEEQGAKDMLEQATDSFNNKNYNEALEILDSLQFIYPEQTAVRREAMALRPIVIEKATQGELEACDSLIKLAQEKYEQAKGKMTFINNPELVEGYWVATSVAKNNFMESTGLQGRVDQSGDFYLISEVNGAGNLHHTSITLALPSGESASSGLVPYDGELNYRIGGSETVTFSWVKADEIGRFAAEHAGQSMTLTFNGENGKTKKITLKEKDTMALADAFNMAHAQKEGKALTGNRALLEKKLELARSQQERLKSPIQ